MARTTTTAGAARPDIYAEISERIIAMLDAGTIPWQRPWAADPDGDALPVNVRGTRYRGINVWLLAMQGHRSPVWMTYKQATGLAGHVRRGEKATQVVLWKPVARKPKAGEPVDPDAKPGQYLVIRQYSVFNLAQVVLPGHALWKLGGRFAPASADSAPTFDPIAAADAIVAGMPSRPPIGHGGDRAFYSPSMDAVTMPHQASFDAPAGYYATLFHELAHATGHESRLGRPTLTEACAFGDTNYSEEELVAEFASAYLAGHAGISPAVVDNSAAYIASWARRFKDDPRMVVMAAQRAQKAADYILAVQAAEKAAPAAQEVISAAA
jgi:antirestriction protein ArdC